MTPFRLGLVSAAGMLAGYAGIVFLPTVATSIPAFVVFGVCAVTFFGVYMGRSKA